MSHSYLSAIDREQFNKIKPILESSRKKTRPRTIDLYDVICGISYILKSGCQWRMLPKEFPKWRTCHYYFTIWSEKINDFSESILEKVLKKIVGEIRQNNDRNEKSSFIIVDAQSVKNTDTAENKGSDAGKKISGVKRHIAVDTQGMPHAIHITTANITDRGAALEMFSLHKDALSNVENILVDGGERGGLFANNVEKLLHCKVEVAKRSELHTFIAST